jgi:hypothetical protein
MGGACCIDCQCRHIGLHMCNHFIGSKFAHFSTNVNSVNFDFNLCISFLGIVRHFILHKFSVLQPVIFNWCANNCDIFYAVCDDFKFDVDNYFNYFSELLCGRVCYNDFDALVFDSLNETNSFYFR